MITNIILLGDFFALKFHFLSLLDARHNTREENNGHNSLRKSDIFDFLGWHVMLIQINNRSRDFNKGNTMLGVVERDACSGFEKNE